MSGKAAICDWDQFDDAEIEDEPEFDCGLGLDGQCSMAGSEDCDWDCPHSHGPLYAGSEGWDKRHNEGTPVEGCYCEECRKAERRFLRGHP